MSVSWLVPLGILICCIGNVHPELLQDGATQLRVKRQNPADLFDTLFNQARTSGVNLYNTLGGLASGLTRSSSMENSSQGANPLSILTQGATTLFAPLLSAGVAAGLDARRLLQNGANTGNEVLQTGAAAASEGSKTFNDAIGSSLDGIRNFTDLGGNIFRSLIPSQTKTASDLNPLDRLFSPSRSSRDLPDPVTKLNRLFIIPLQFFRTAATPESSKERNIGGLDLGINFLRQLLFRPRAVGSRPSKPAGNAIEKNRDDLAESVDLLGLPVGKQVKTSLDGSEVNKIPRR